MEPESNSDPSTTTPDPSLSDATDNTHTQNTDLDTPNPSPQLPPDAPTTGFTPEEYDAQKFIESYPKGQAAVSSAGAIGVRQIKPSTFDDEKRKKADGSYEDINNEADNDAVGKRYLDKQLRKYQDYPDAKEFALTAYNAGAAHVDAAIHAAKLHGEEVTYDNIQKYLPTKEAKEYVGRFRNRLNLEKPTSVQQVAKDVEPGDTGSTTPDYFQQTMLPIVTDPSFDKLPFNQKLDTLGQVLKSRKWDAPTYDVASKLANTIWNSADPKELPDIQDIVGAAPMTGAKPEQELAKWRDATTQKLLRDGIPLALFGSKLNDYYNTATENELAAATVRNRGALGFVANRAGNYAREAAKGAIQNVTGPAAGAAELAQYPDTADYIRKLPEWLGTPARDFEYNLNTDGSIATNPDGSPQRKWQGDIAKGLGQLGGLLAGGAALKGAEIVGEGALATGLFTTQAVQNGGDVYKAVKDATGSNSKAYGAALMSIGPTALMSAGQMAVISKWANPELSGLSQFSKALYMGNTMARNAAVEAVAQGAGDIGLQNIEGRYTGAKFDPSRTLETATIGALAGGVVSGIHASGAEAPKASDFTPGPLQTRPERLGLPAPAEAPLPSVPLPGIDGQLALPPGTDGVQKQLPDLRLSDDPRVKALGQSHDLGAIPIQVSDSERAAIADKLESFQDSGIATLNLTQEQARTVSPDLLNALQMTMTPNGDNFIVSNKYRTYIDQDSENLGQVNSMISGLEKDLSQSLTKENMPASAEELKALKTELKARTAELGIKGEEANQRMTTLVRGRSKLQKAYDDASAAYYAEEDPELRSIAKSDLRDRQAALDAYDAQNGAGRSAYNRLGRIQDRIDVIKDKLTKAQTNGYISDLKAKDNNLANLYKKRQLLENNLRNMAGHDVAEPVQRSIIKIGNKELIPHENKWYLRDENGDITSKHDYYTDAVNSVNDTPTENTFIVKHTNRTEERPGDREAAVARVNAERQDQELLKRKQDAEERSRKAIKVAIDKVSSDIYEREYNKEVSNKRKEAQDSVAAQRKGNKSDKAYKRKSSESLEGEGLRTGPSTTSEGSNAGTPGGSTVRGGRATAQDDGTPNVESTVNNKPNEAEAENLKPSASSRSRILRLEPKRPLTSSYTEPIKFARDGALVSAKQVKEALNGLLKRLGKRQRIVEGQSLPRGVLGQHNSLRGIIATARHNDVAAMVHEVAHGVDREIWTRWGTNGVPDPSSVPKEVLDAARNTADTFYPQDPSNPLSDASKIKEGMAVFYQHYAGGEPVHKTILNWYHNDFADSNPRAYEALEDIKDLAHDYQNQTDENYLDSRVVDKPSKLQKLKDKFSFYEFRKKNIDRAAIIADIDKNTGDKHGLKDMYDLDFRRGGALANHSISKSLVDLDGNQLEGLTYKQAISPAQGHLGDFRRYLVAKRSLAEFQKGRDPGQGFEEVSRIVKKVEETLPDVVLAAHNHWDYFDKQLEIIGSSSQEMRRTVDKIKEANLKATGKTHGFYSPFEREGKASVSPLKSTVGSTRNIVDPLKTVEGVVQDLYTQALHSKFKEALVTAATEPGAFTSIGKYMQDVTGNERAEALKLLTTKIRERTKNPDLSESEALQNAGLFDFIQAPHNEKQALMHYFDGTEDKVLAVHPDILKLFKDELPDYVNSPWFKLLRGFGATLRIGATSLRPVFQLKQLIRDPLTAYRYVDSGRGGAVDAISLAKNITFSLMDDILHHTHAKQDGWTALTERLGVIGSTRAGSGDELIRQLRNQYGDNVVNMAHATLNKFEHLLSVPERSVRQAAVRMEAHRLGINDPNQKLTTEQALSLGLAYKRSTTNFQIQGEGARVFNMIKPFYSARIAELSRLPSDIKRNPGRSFGLFGSMLAYGILHAYEHKDEAWYQELTPDQKTSNAFFTTDVNGVKKAVAIPLESVGSLGFGLGQLIGNKIHEDPNAPIAYSQLVAAYLQPHLPVDVPLNPTWEGAGQSLVSLGGPLVTEIAQQLANKDFYFNKQIVPPSYDFKSRAEQYNQYTSELSKKVASYVPGVSPMRLDHAMHAVLPVSTDILGAVDQATGAKEQKEYAGADFVLKALTRAGSADGIMDRSQQLFTNKLLDAREGEGTESPKDGVIRKGLEKLNKAVSDINTVINGTPDFDEKSKLQATKRAFLQQGIRIANGSEEIPLSSGLAGAAKQIRTQQKAQKQAELSARTAE